MPISRGRAVGQGHTSGVGERVKENPLPLAATGHTLTAPCQGEHSLIFRSQNWPCMLGVREQFHVNTLRMGGPDDGFRSSPFARGVS
jgi:hypothetical protein